MIAITEIKINLKLKKFRIHKNILIFHKKLRKHIQLAIYLIEIKINELIKRVKKVRILFPYIWYYNIIILYFIILKL